jgi:MYXO-CTERM domain-containing protein
VPNDDPDAGIPVSIVPPPGQAGRTGVVQSGCSTAPGGVPAWGVTLAALALVLLRRRV